MRIFRFMSVEEFKQYLDGGLIEGRFDGWTACFLEKIYLLGNLSLL